MPSHDKIIIDTLFGAFLIISRLFCKIVSLLKDQNERPKTRDILNTLYLFALPNAPKFTRNSFENFERFDSWLIQLYVKVQGAKTTAEEIIKCFLLNLEYEDVRGVINTNSITTKY